jgi:hypothetical protein
MPRPTTAQLACGSLTVVLSTFAMLLLSGARSGTGVVIIAAAGLVLGLLAALAVAAQSARRPAAAPVAASVPASASLGTPAGAGLPHPRVPGGSETRVGEHSLRG